MWTCIRYFKSEDRYLSGILIGKMGFVSFKNGLSFLFHLHSVLWLSPEWSDHSTGLLKNPQSVHSMHWIKSRLVDLVLSRQQNAPLHPLLIQYARCAMLPSPPRPCPCVLSKVLCPPVPPTPSPLSKFQLRGQILKKVLPDLPHSESEPISPCLCFKTHDNSIRAFVPICCFSN